MEPNIDEILRYLSIRGEIPDGLRERVGRAANALAESLRPKYVYRVSAGAHRGRNYFTRQRRDADRRPCGEDARNLRYGGVALLHAGHRV